MPRATTDTTVRERRSRNQPAEVARHVPREDSGDSGESVGSVRRSADALVEWTVDPLGEWDSCVLAFVALDSAGRVVLSLSACVDHTGRVRTPRFSEMSDRVHRVDVVDPQSGLFRCTAWSRAAGPLGSRVRVLLPAGAWLLVATGGIGCGATRRDLRLVLPDGRRHPLSFAIPDRPRRGVPDDLLAGGYFASTGRVPPGTYHLEDGATASRVTSDFDVRDSDRCRIVRP